MKRHRILLSILMAMTVACMGCASDSDSKNDTLDTGAIIDSDSKNNALDTAINTVPSLAVVNTRLGSESNISLVNYTTGAVEKDLLDLEGACYLAQNGENIYIVDKVANKIIKWDYKTKIVVKDLSTGDATKPYAVCFASEAKAYATLNNVSYIFVFNPTTMEKIGEIDLSSLEAPDKKMQAYFCAIKDDKLFVTLRHNTKNADKESSLAVISVTDDTLMGEIPLQTDGVSGMGQDAIGGKPAWESDFSGDMYVSVVNSMTDPTDGDIEIVNDTDSDHPTTQTISSEADAGGSIAMWVFDTNHTGWAIIGVKPNYSLVRYDLSGVPTFTKAPVFQDRIYSYAMDCTQEGLLLVGSKDENDPGIWVYDTKNNYAPRFNTPLKVGLLPNRILILK